MEESAKAYVKRRRTIWIWIISLPFFVLGATTLLSYAFYIASGTLTQYAPQYASYLETWSLTDRLYYFIIGCLQVSGAIALFSLRRVAYQLFAIQFAIMFFSLTLSQFSRGWIQKGWSMGPGGFLLGVSLAVVPIVATWAYVHHLERSGVLR